MASRILLYGAFLAGLAASPAMGTTLVVANNNDVVNGDTSSPAALIANPGPDGISLREATMAVGNVPGPNTITFATALAGQSIVLGNPLPAILQNQVTLTGLTTGDGQPNITIDGSQAVAPGPTMFVGASSFTLRGVNFVFTPGTSSAIQVGGFTYNNMGQKVFAAPYISGIQIIGNTFSNPGNPGNGGFAIAIGSSSVPAAVVANVTVANNTFSLLFEAVRVGSYGTDDLTEDVTISGNSFSQMTSSGTSAVELGEAGTGNVQRRIRITQNTFTGNFQGIVTDNGGSNGLVDDTLIAGNAFVGNLGAIVLVGGVGSGVTGNTISNTAIVNNLVYRSGFNGTRGGVAAMITPNDQGASGNTVSGVSVVDNTFVGAGGPSGSSVWVTSTNGVSGVTVLNTIAWGNSGGDFTNLSASQVRNSITAQSGFFGVKRQHQR